MTQGLKFQLTPHDSNGKRNINVRLEITSGQIWLEFAEEGVQAGKDNDTAHVLVENWEDRLILRAWRKSNIGIDPAINQILDEPTTGAK